MTDAASLSGNAKGKSLEKSTTTSIRSTNYMIQSEEST